MYKHLKPEIKIGSLNKCRGIVMLHPKYNIHESNLIKIAFIQVVRTPKGDDQSSLSASG